MHLRALLPLLVPCVSLACSGTPQGPTDVIAVADATDITAPRDVQSQDTAPDVPGYDAGNAPACMVTARATHIVDRPSGDLEADPQSLVRVSNGFLAGLRRVDFATPDGGVIDGGRIPDTRNSAEVLALGDDGTPRSTTTTTLYDGAPESIAVDAPQLLPSPTGAFAVFQVSRGNLGDPDFTIALRSAQIAADGALAQPSEVFRDRYTRPWIAPLLDGNSFGVSQRFEGTLDGGVVAARPVTMLLLPDGGNARTSDGALLGFIPGDATDAVVTSHDDGGAFMLFQSGGRLGFIRFDRTGLVDSRSPYQVPGASLPGTQTARMTDAAGVGDGVIAAWTRNEGARSEVHVIVASDRGALRLDRELESFTGEGETVATVARAWGGAVVLWRRGTGAMARVRAAVVAPDGVVRVEPTDLVAAANIDGRIAAVVDGRRVSFVARDGTDPAWGLTFGEACLPGM